MADSDLPPAPSESEFRPPSAVVAPGGPVGGVNPTPAPAPSSSLPPVSELDVDELRTSIHGIRQTVNLALAGLVVTLASVNVILFHQIAALRGQVLEISRNEKQMIGFLEDHRTNGVPHFVRFIQEMNKFAAQDPEFAQILAKFPKFEIPTGPGAALPGGKQPVQF